MVEDNYTGLEDYTGECAPIEPATCIRACRGLPVHMTHKPELLEWEDVRPGVWGISEATCVFFHTDGRTQIIGDEEKFLAALCQSANAKKAILFRNGQKLFTAAPGNGAL